MSYLDLSIKEIHQALVDKKTTPLELTIEALSRAKSSNDNAFEIICEKEAIAFASSLTEVDKDNLLWGIPYCVKDNLSTKGIETTASSKTMDGYIPLFDATVVAKLKEKKSVLIGKTTMDELAMGGYGISWKKGVTYNPFDQSRHRMIGGSSCGSAAATASSIVPFSLGSDTGDSVRKPASFGGLVGFKPTWGRISRYGLFPFAPSLDHIAYFTRSVEDASILLNVLAGRDENDSTSSSLDVAPVLNEGDASLKGKRIAVIEEIIDAISDSVLMDKFNRSLEMMEKEGAIIERVSFPFRMLKSILATYFVISSAEATSNTANIDGIKFGPYKEGNTFKEVMFNARNQGFSNAIKRRFVIGSFALMSENRDELFVLAQKNRARLVAKLNELFESHDLIYVPAAPSIAPEFEQKSANAEKALVANNHLALGNFAGLPSLTIPLGLEDGFPLGVNFMGRAFEENTVLEAALSLERITGLKGLSSIHPKEGNL